jgi:sec-independent protein translocase protein TatA
METIGPWELLIIVVAIGLLFGANRLPQMARNLGEGIREFRNALHDENPPDTAPPTHKPSADGPPER